MSEGRDKTVLWDSQRKYLDNVTPPKKYTTSLHNEKWAWSMNTHTMTQKNNADIHSKGYMCFHLNFVRQ